MLFGGVHTPPRYFHSPSTSSQRESAPVAITRDCAVNVLLLVVICRRDQAGGGMRE